MSQIDQIGVGKIRRRTYNFFNYQLQFEANAIMATNFPSTTDNH